MTDQGQPVLYHNDLSTCAQKVRLTLAEKNIQWDSRELDLRAGDQKSREFLSLNPSGMVPVLVHEDNTVTESTIIMEYIEDRFPDPALRPNEPAEKAQMRWWMKQLDDRLHMLTGVLSFALAFRHEYLALPDRGRSLIEPMTDPMAKAGKMGLLEQGADFPAVGVALDAFANAFRRIEETLSANGSEYLTGPYSLADAAWTPYLNRFDHLGLTHFWDKLDRTSAWWERLQMRASFNHAITAVEKPDRVALMKEKAAEAKPRISRWLEDVNKAT